MCLCFAVSTIFADLNFALFLNKLANPIYKYKINIINDELNFPDTADLHTGTSPPVCYLQFFLNNYCGQALSISLYCGQKLYNMNDIA